MRAKITLTTPGTGDPLECVLLEKKTRKGGWKAKFLKRGAKGPTMNSAEVPKSAKPGQVIHLGVGVISDDGKRVQFHWHAHNAGLPVAVLSTRAAFWDVPRPISRNRRQPRLPAAVAPQLRSETPGAG